MKKLTKHLAAVAMALAVAVTALVPVTAEAKPSYNEKITVYRTNANASYTSSTSIYVGNLGKSDTIKKSSVKSSNTKSVKLNYLEKYHSEYATEYFSGSNGYGGKSYSYYIGLSLLKPGKSTVSFKIGKKGYKSVVNVVKYENPLKTATILGKNYAGKLKSQSTSYKDIKAKSTQKNQKFTFEGNKNWKISSVEISKYEKVGKNSYYSSTYTQRWSYSSSPKSKVSCGVGNIEKGKYYQVNVSMTNTKTGGSMVANFYINYPYNY